MNKQKTWLILPVIAILFGQVFQRCLCDDSYENMTDLMDRLLGSKSGYNPDFRPRNHYSDRVNVTIGFSIVSLIEVDNVKQSIKVNGFLLVKWDDERCKWNKSEFGGARYLAPKPKNIWRPRLILMNTLGDRDVFKDDYSPMTIYSNGVVLWWPGGLFEASCGLDMRKFPFDEQSCFMLFCPINHPYDHMIFSPVKDQFDFSFLIKNEAWELISSTVLIEKRTPVVGDNISCPNFILTMKRRSGYFVINLILPVIVLSFLNNFVFLIPDSSGEKISYGITVLLSLSVFLTTVSTMVPRASDNIPAVTVYLFILLLFSCISVLKSIAAIFLRNCDEDKTAHCKTPDMFQRAIEKVTNLKQTSTKIDPVITEHDNPFSQTQREDEVSYPLSDAHTGSSKSNNTSPSNKYHRVAKHINTVCFVVSTMLWAITQITFFDYVMS